MGRDHDTKSNKSWSKHQTKSKWKNILAVFIAVTLMFAVVNGLAKGFSIKNKISKPKWDGKSSMSIAINTPDPALFIYQPKLKNLVLFTISGETLFETGYTTNPLETLSSVANNNGEELVGALSKTYEAKIANYFILQNIESLDEESAKKMFLNFTSITTPVKLLTTGWGENILNTNVTRIDALKLWWQVKSLSAEELILADLTEYQEEIITEKNEKVLGADTTSLNRVISKYLENLVILEENKDITIKNASKSNRAVNLAASFIASEGGSVGSVEENERIKDKTILVTKDKNSYTARHLANIFNCDINEAETGVKTSEITLIVGTDFTSRYYE